MLSVYNSLPTQQSLKEVQRQGVSKAVQNVFRRVAHEFEGFKEPEILMKDSQYTDFDAI